MVLVFGINDGGVSLYWRWMMILMVVLMMVLAMSNVDDLGICYN